MKGNDLDRHMGRVAAHLRKLAERMRPLDGRQRPDTLAILRRHSIDDETTETRVMLTRDEGHHTSGWMKNPDYERCLHLSLSPKPPTLVLPYARVLDRKMAALWVKAIFGDDQRYTWMESPKSRLGRQADVWHWRLFCDASWAPILPRGEVYSTELTELGWKSASELGADIISTLDPP